MDSWDEFEQADGLARIEIIPVAHVTRLVQAINRAAVSVAFTHHAPAGCSAADTPVSPEDILATALYLLGVDPHTTVLDLLKRPVPVAGEGNVRTELFG